MIAQRKRRTPSGRRQEYSYSPMIWIKDANGRHQHWGGSFRTKAEAKTEERRLLQERDAGTDLKPVKLTVAEVCAQYLTEKVKTVRASTLQRNDELLRHVVAVMGNIALARLLPADVSDLHNRLLQQLSKRTVRHAHWQLHGALALAVRWGQVSVNVASRVDPPEPDAFEGHALTCDEMDRLLECSRSAAVGPLIMLALDSTAREGELLALRWSDIDFDTRRVHIGRSVRKLKDGFSFSEPKTKRSKRTVEISAPSVAVLKGHRQHQLEARLRAGDLWTDLDLVFPADLGTPQSGSYISRAFRKVAAAAGLTNFRFHDLRHSSVSLLLMSGEPMANVSRRAGHSSIGITVDTYGHQLDAGGSMASTMGTILQHSIGDPATWLANG